MLLRRILSIVGILAVLLAIIALAPGEVSAAPRPAEEHCVFEVVGVDERGKFFTAPPICFDTERQAAGAALSRVLTARGGLSQSLAGMNSMSTTVIARHYTGASYSGSTATITGTACNGGTWKPSGAWNNNIESTLSYCGGEPITHYDASSCSGAGTTILSSATSLGSMNNKTSCVRYG